MTSPTPSEVHRVLAMISNLAWKEFTDRDRRVAEWVVHWNDEGDAADVALGRKEDMDSEPERDTRGSGSGAARDTNGECRGA